MRREQFTDDASEVFETSDKGFPMDEFWRPAEGQPEDVTALIRMHTTPFYNECRAFGRLKEMDREHLAVKAYGYVRFHADERYDKLVLDSERRRKRDSVDPAECFREPIKPREHIFRGVRFDGTVDTRPVMGIVKDWVAPRAPLQTPSPDDWENRMPQPSQMPAMLRDLHEMHRIGIVNRDINPAQYIDGVLLDFSKAWTIPHALGPESGILPFWTFPSMAAWDLWSFQQFIVKDWNWMVRQRNGTSARGDKKRLPISRLRAYPTEYQPPPGGGPPGPGRTREGVLGTLRPRAHRHGPFLPLLDTPHMEFDKLPFTVWPRHDPAAFDWRGITLRGEDPHSGRAQPGQGEKNRAGEGRETGGAVSGESVDEEECKKTSGKGKAAPPCRGTRKRARHSQC